MIAIIKGCGNNIASIQYTLERLGYASVLTTDIITIKNASHVILPGVGHAATAMRNLRRSGLDQLLPQLLQPVLGICLGMQLLYESSEEGETTGLQLIPGRVKKFTARVGQIFPHMGWNQLYPTGANQVIDQVGQYVYFVHSYMAPINEHTVMTTDYGENFTSMVQYRNFTGMQFHPERSGSIGENLLNHFLNGV